ncbi:MAG: ABC transporter permease [Acidobacteriota bacterium]
MGRSSMPILPRLRNAFRHLRDAAPADRDLDLELRAHVEMLEQEKIDGGLSPEAARREALFETGGIEQVKASVREVRAGAFLASVLQDLRYGARTLARTPAFTLAAIIALALGIGASTAIFSVVNAVLLRPLPYRDPGSLAVLLHKGRNPVSAPNFRDWQRESRSFAAMGAAQGWQPNLMGGQEPERIEAVRMTSEILPMLGVSPFLGRVFAPNEDEAGKDHEVVLSHALWRRKFGADRGVVGRAISLDGEPYTVVGVMPPEFRFPPFWQTGAQLWAPLALDRNPSRDGNSLRVFARLKPGVPNAGAQAEITGLTGRLEKEFPGTNRDVFVRSLHETVVGRVRPALLVLLAAVGFLLLIACGNVAHMLLARSAARQKEVAVRTAIGASRGRLIRQFLTESLLLALSGGAAGLLLALAATRVIVSIRPLGLPAIDTLSLDVRVLAFSLVVSISTGVAFGLAPALASARRDLSESLREGERGSTEGRGRHRLRSILVGSEFALALILLVAAGLMIRTFVALRAVDPGFDPRHVLSMVVSVSGSPSVEPGRRGVFYPGVLDRVRALPGVRSASFINHLPLAGDIWGFPFAVEGRPAPPRGDAPTAAYRVVLPGYFQTMGLPLRRGRDIASADRLGTPGVVVVNEWLANRFWPGEDAIGKRIALGGGGESPPDWLTVIGVVKNAARSDWTAPADSEIYVPLLQSPRYLETRFFAVEYLTLVVATSGDPAAAAGSVRNAVHSIDPAVTISDVQTMEHAVGQANAQPRFYLMLLSAFAAVAILLAAVGIYGVMSYVVSRRAHEMGIRMALGARRADLFRLVVGQGMAVALAGAAAGLAGALVLTRLMSGLLYKVPPTDVATFAGVTAVLIGVALAATWIPARRATRIDPMTALRAD